MAKALVLDYSSYGHFETMAKAVAEGVVSAGSQVDIKRVPETGPKEAAGFRVNPDHPEAHPDDLPKDDAIIVGAPTNYGVCPSIRRHST